MTTQNIDPLVIALAPANWAVKHIDNQPELDWSDWAIFEAKMAHPSVLAGHFAGYNVRDRDRDREGRASCAIVTLDLVALTGVAESGRVYHLRGRPGLRAVGLYFWGRRLRINKSTDVVEITNSVLP